MKRLALSMTVAAMLMACSVAPPFSDMAAGQATRADVLSRYGAPTRNWKNADGTEILQYATQPFGTSTHVITLAQDGRVLRVEDSLSEQGRAKITRGMTREEVSQWLGPHRSAERFPLSGEEVWDWNIYTVYARMEQRFNVHFKEGKVVRTSITNVFPRDLLDDF